MASAFTVADYNSLVEAISTADPLGIQNVATGWATLAGNLQAASDELTRHQAGLLAAGWSSPATENFNDYVAAWQQKAGALISASHAVSGALYTASDKVSAAAAQTPSMDQVGFAATGFGTQQTFQQAKQASDTLNNAYLNAKATIENVHSTMPVPGGVEAFTPVDIVGSPSSGGSPGVSLPYRPSVPEVTSVPLASGGADGSALGGRAGRVASGAPASGGVVGVPPSGGVTAPAGLGGRAVGGALSAGGMASGGGSAGDGGIGGMFVPGVGWVPAARGGSGAGTGARRAAAGLSEDPAAGDDAGIVGGTRVPSSSAIGTALGRRGTQAGTEDGLPDHGDGVFGGEPLAGSGADGFGGNAARGAAALRRGMSSAFDESGYDGSAGGASSFGGVGDRVAGYDGVSESEAGYRGSGYAGSGYGGTGYDASGYGPSVEGGSVTSGAADSRLNASQAEEESASVQRAMRGASGAAGLGEGEAPFAPMGGVGGSAGQERQRGKRPRYLREDPRTWQNTTPVVPPVIDQ